MVTSPSPPLAGTRPIEKLPTELLEKILLEVVNSVKCPIIYEDTGQETLRSQEEIEQGASLAKGLLAHRLVSRTMRGCSWRGLGRVVCETVFDLRSAQSFENLTAVSERKELAPWISKFTVAFFAVKDSYPFSELVSPLEMANNMDKGSREELLRIRASDRRWSDETWRWGETTQTQSMLQTEQRLRLGDGSKTAVDLLTRCINLFPNLSYISYYFNERETSARFRGLARQHRNKTNHRFSVGDEIGEHGAYLGMHLVTEAMIRASFRPNKLDLHAYLHEPHYFNVPVSFDRLKDVFSKVEHLKLSNLCSLGSHQHETTSSESVVTIDRNLFPALHSLTLQADWCHEYEDDSSVPIPTTNHVSELNRITIIYGWQSSPKLLGFLHLFKPTLQSVTLRQMEDVSYKPILTALRSFNLDMLAIYDGYDEWWDEESADPKGYRGVPMEAFDGIAKTLILRPPQKENASSNGCANRNESTENTHPGGEFEETGETEEDRREQSIRGDY
ncbi:hypothetical protein FB567DRAFT_593023 [Paraphoma chrysanthemicola]|uniref:Uncharacterized protein n=1 Tax=Paraphoma chrysanthemicola TaxID=798071 RepID=A0A8K0R444_9PLEO|nr:hypothetical protein FB567DRAFT_593023 [Paraphoma chrysanthemicola]